MKSYISHVHVCCHVHYHVMYMIMYMYVVMYMVMYMYVKYMVMHMYVAMYMFVFMYMYVVMYDPVFLVLGYLTQVIISYEIYETNLWLVYFTIYEIITSVRFCLSYEPRCEKTASAKTKTQISFAVTTKLISAFVFAIRIVQSLYYVNLKFQASSHLLWLYSLVCVGPGRKPRRPVFSEQGSYDQLPFFH